MLLVLMPRPRRAHVLSLGLDFGLARVTREGLLSRWPTSTSAAGVIVGTPAYLAPEQIRGLPIDERVDLYAAGVILFEALTRRLPFLGSEYEVLTAHVGEPPPSPRAIVGADAIPTSIEAIVLRALAKDPAARFALRRTSTRRSPRRCARPVSPRLFEPVPRDMKERMRPRRHSRRGRASSTPGRTQAPARRRGSIRRGGPCGC